MTDTTLGRRIAQRRRMLSLSQEALGDKMEVSRQASSKWEADAAVPEVDRLVQMSRLFGVSVGWLLGTETGPVTETAVPDLTDTIAQTLRPAPPEPEPGPEPPASPTPPPPPTPTPHRWLLPVCATVTAASLLLSAISLSVALSPKEIPAPTTDPSLTAKLEDLTDQIGTLKGDLERAHTRLDGMWDENMKLALRLHDLEKAGGEPSPTPVAPGNDTQDPSTGPTEPTDIPDSSLIQNSGLTSCRYLPDEEAILVFNCTAKEPLTTMSLIALNADGDLFTAVCGRQDDRWTGELRVPLMDGYRYYLKIQTAAGEEKTISFIGHGLEDLYSGYLQPQIEARPNKTPFGNHSTERFWAGYDGVLLTPPPLTPDTGAPVWEVERIEYWYNGTYVASHDLTDLLTKEQRTSPSVNFPIPTQTFDLAGMEEGDTHQLRLHIRMDFGDAVFSSVLDLSTWVVEDGKLVLQ